MGNCGQVGLPGWKGPIVYVSRRSWLRFTGGSVVTAVSGCSGKPASVTGDVIAGPDGRPVFEPAELTVAVGESAVWYFDSSGHNVSGRPRDSGSVTLPEDASPFSSYGVDESALTLAPRGVTYEHRFGTPGTYQYVCIPHVSAGMVGRVIVSDG